jgi:hypothetical protein
LIPVSVERRYTGAMVLIQKPFSPEQPADKVREMLDAPSLVVSHSDNQASAAVRTVTNAYWHC